jgi:AmmeMemoRadiSam system protein A
MELTLTEADKQLLLQMAREAILANLAGRAARFPEPTPSLKRKCGAFVTLHEGEELRGCIGFVTASKPLHETVQEAAVSSAFHDPRFPPLSKGEYPQVRVEISVLSPFRPIRSVEEIQVGVHGIMMRRGFNSGLLLPQVATEYGWDRETFLTHTCRKAGLPGDCWQRGDTTIEIFSAIVFGEKQ